MGVEPRDVVLGRHVVDNNLAFLHDFPDVKCRRATRALHAKKTEWVVPGTCRADVLSMFRRTCLSAFSNPSSFIMLAQ